jgi:Predicted membrane protein
MTVALLFELDKFGLSAYLRFSTFETVYGALGAFPVFLLWLYVAWASILFGAEMAEAGVYSDKNPLNPAHKPDAPVKTDK